MITMRIRQSHARTFRACERKYKLQAIDKLVTKDHSVALSIGTACHAGRANYLKFRDKMQAIEVTAKNLRAQADLFPSLEERKHDDKLCHTTRQTCLRCALAMSMEVINGYADYFEKEFGDSIQVLAIELPFELKIAEFEDLEFVVAGTIDADVIWAEKYRLNFEYKTTKKQLPIFLEEEHLSSQHTTYPMVLSKITGSEVYGTLLDVSRKPLKTQGPEFGHKLLPKYADDYAAQIRDYEELLKHIAYAVDKEYFPPNFDSCFTRYGQCEYYPICRSNFSPHALQEYVVIDDNIQMTKGSDNEE